MRRVPDEMIHRVRRLVPPSWMILQSNARDLFVGVPADADPRLVHRLDGELARIDFCPKDVTKRERKRLFDLLRRDVPTFTTVTVSSEDNLATPVDLNTRLFWLTKRCSVVRPRRWETLEALLRLKVSYESRHGASYPDEFRIGSAEIRRFLYDPTSVRGPRMLEILFKEGETLSVELRTTARTLRSTDTALVEYVDDLSHLVDEILGILHESETSEPCTSPGSAPEPQQKTVADPKHHRPTERVERSPEGAPRPTRGRSSRSLRAPIPGGTEGAG
jgi:hypothetical protein